MSSQKPLKVIAGTPDKPLVLVDTEIPCYVLENEMRVLTQSGMFSGLGLARRGLVSVEGGAQIPRFAASKSVKPFITKELMDGLTNPILFTSVFGKAYGFPATILADICEIILEARDAGSLDRQQKKLADRCQILMRGFARVGIDALVDEVTGYQKIRNKRALQAILDKYLSKELSAWAKIFPDDFYDRIFKLKGWSGPDGAKKPSVIGRYTNNIVYERLAPGVLDELKRRNPTLSSGRRRASIINGSPRTSGNPN